MSRFIFVDAEVDQRVIADHQRAGGRGLCAAFAKISRHHTLRYFAAFEPLGIGARHFHISISVGLGCDPGPVRKPTNEEIEAVKNCFRSYQFVTEVDEDDPRVIHLWESR